MIFRIRFATPDDAATIFGFIRDLAAYEREPQAVETSVEVIREQLLESPAPFECLVAEAAGGPMGFALFFHNYSTWRGRRGVYLEDLYVSERYRGQGVGKALLASVAGIASERGCPRFEWAVLDWNRPAIDFYESLGARAMSEWTVFRVTGESLAQLAAGSHLPRAVRAAGG
ncbi:MAG: GNAT family N-acetyltransferase [Candidatus Schekmanbacteria bacterium]|nr:GNAT family N-acetyltransferase [Candidatus Schekmanbacteria bacterium]